MFEVSGKRQKQQETGRNWVKEGDKGLMLGDL